MIEKTFKLITSSPVPINLEPLEPLIKNLDNSTVVPEKNDETGEDIEVSVAILKKIHYESPLNFRSDWYWVHCVWKLRNFDVVYIFLYSTIDPTLIWSENESNLLEI